MQGLGKPLSHGFCFRFKQWGSQSAGDNWIIYYPLAYTKQVCYTDGIDNGADSSSHQYIALAANDAVLNKFKIITSSNTDVGLSWISIGF